MNKFKINDSVKSIYGFGVVHDINANGSRYLVDDDEGFSWIKEEELELIDTTVRWWSKKEKWNYKPRLTNREPRTM